MKFIEYKDILKDNNIHLFDYDYRNSFKNIYILNDFIYQDKNQYGGSNDEFFASPFTILKGYDNNKIQKLIDQLTSNNIVGAKFICKI